MPKLHAPRRLLALSVPVVLMLAVSAAADWSEPVKLFDDWGRLAIGDQVHAVGSLDGNLVHRTSADDGATWSQPNVIGPASSNFPMQYHGLYAQGSDVYLITHPQRPVRPNSEPLLFRKSSDHGQTWTDPIMLSAPGETALRGQIVVSGNNVHVLGGQALEDGFGTGLYYFRSTDGGANWDDGMLLYQHAGASAGLAVDGETVHVAFSENVASDRLGGATHHMRSLDNGETWSVPTFVGEADIEGRPRVVAADGQIFVIWQRENQEFGIAPGVPLPDDRLGYNRSLDGGETWLGPELLPHDTGIDRNHMSIWLNPGGELHVTWLHGSWNLNPPTGYLFSPDYGQTWIDASEIPIDLPGPNQPFGIVADDNWVHIIGQPGPGTYVRRAVIPEPSSLALLGASGLVLMFRRRRKDSI